MSGHAFPAWSNGNFRLSKRTKVMKLNNTSPIPSSLRFLGLSLALMALLQFSSRAHPYASGVVVSNGVSSTNVFFTMNEAGATVTVTFEDSTSTNLGVLPKGQTNFALVDASQGLAHTSYRISCFKQGAGSPTLISDDAYTFSQWTNGSGFAVNHNPKNGALFGRLYVANCSATGGTSNKVVGIYALNADQTFVAVSTTNASGVAWIGGSYSSNFKSPGRIRVAPDNTLLVADGRGSGGQNRVYQFAPDLSANWALLGPASSYASIDDLFGTPVAFGSTNTGDLVLYTASAGVGAPGDTNCILGPLTFQGSFNCIYKYNIGSGPLPWTKRPDYAYTVGLDGIATLRVEEDVLPNGEIIAAFGRANGSNPNLQILRPALTTNGPPYFTNAAKVYQDAAKDQTNWLYTSGVYNPPFNSPPPGGTGTDPWNGSATGLGIVGTYGSVRTSPDGQFFASMDNDNGLTLAYMTNGIPNEATIFTINNTSTAGNQGGMDWDAANNVWALARAALPTSANPQARLRCYSLGLTTTCVTSNDWTGTNGTFSLVLPGATASITVVSNNASQNYVNCNAPTNGTPIPGVFRINLNTNNLTGPTTVSFVRGGTAAFPLNYTLNTNETPNGITITPTSVIFPAGIYGGANGPNWNVDVKVIPTATPVSGPTLTFTVRLNSGTNYSAAPPLNGTVTILNTGPQLLQLAAAAPASLGGMNRGIPNDQARFVITRLGDLNGPGNDGVNPVVQRTMTVSAVDLLPPASGASFMANNPLDYTAGPQNFNNAVLLNSSPGITLAPGVASVTAAIGNPVSHTNPNLTRTNLQVVVSLTNTTAIGGPLGTPASTTNVLSGEGYVYQVTTASVALTEFDNAKGGEVVLWSNPLTNSYDSTNWTLVFASTAQGCEPTPPLVSSNYDNQAIYNSGAYSAQFGQALSTEPGISGITVPQSAEMAANGWTTALRVSVNKDPGQSGESGVNLYPQIPGAPWNGGSNFMVFQGNYALRFDMYLSLYDFGLNNPTIGTPAREYAAFGINHYGTNANWRLDINPRQDGTGAYPNNADGEWCSIGAASGTITPADWDMFISPAFVQPIFGPVLVNSGTNMFGTNDPTCVTACNIVYTNGFVNTNAQTVPFRGTTFIGTAFTNAVQCPFGSYTGVTNVFANAGVPNDQESANNNAAGGSLQNGILKNPPFVGINKLGGAPDNAWVDVSLELTRQTNLTLKVAQQAIFNSSIITPIFGTQNPIAPFGGTPMLGYLDPNRDISDYSAFVYYSNVRIVELSPFIPWTNQPVAGLIVTQGQSFSLTSGATFASNPLTNVWYVGTTNGPSTAGTLDNGTPTAAIFTNTFAATNGITNLTIASTQSGTNYIATWSDQAGTVTGFVSVVEVVPSPGNKTALLGTTANFTVVPTGNAPPTSYQWKFDGTNLLNSAHYGGVTTASLFITNVTAADAGVYSNLVVNPYGSVVVAGTLSINFGFEPFHFTGVSTNTSTNTTLAFTTLGPSDTTASFTLQSAGIVTGPYTNNATGVFSGTNPNFLVTVPKTGSTMFYRLKHN
jgi:hypothetical protein